MPTLRQGSALTLDAQRRFPEFHPGKGHAAQAIGSPAVGDGSWCDLIIAVMALSVSFESGQPPMPQAMVQLATSRGMWGSCHAELAAAAA